MDSKRVRRGDDGGTPASPRASTPMPNMQTNEPIWPETDWHKENPGASLQPSAQPSIAMVADQPFFKGLKPEHLQILADSALQVQFQPGQQIFREGDPANRFYLILRGKVVLEMEGKNGQPARFMTLGPGDDLGWSWLFAPYYLHFSASAVEPTSAIFFYGTRLRKQCDRDHSLGYAIVQRVAKVVIKRLEISQRRLL